MEGEDKCEQKDDAEANDKKVMVKFKLQSNLMFKGKVREIQTYISIMYAKMPTQPKRGIKPPGDGTRYQEKPKNQSVETEIKAEKRDRQKLGRSATCKATANKLAPPCPIPEELTYV